MNIQGRIVDTSNREQTTLQAGDLIIYDAYHQCISFARPGNDSEFGIICDAINYPIPGSLHLSMDLTDDDAQVMIALLTAATGMTADLVSMTKTCKTFRFK